MEEHTPSLAKQDTVHAVPQSLDIPEYMLRQELHAELNAVAYELLAPPFELSHLVLLSERSAVDQERGLLRELCARYDVAPPNSYDNDFSADFGEFRLRWERHTEYSTYTIYRPRHQQG